MKKPSNKLLLFIFIVLILFAVGFSSLDRMDLDRDKSTDDNNSIASIVLSGKEYKIDIASSEKERVRGLSGREDLGDDIGLLFIFEDEDFHGIWMKEMLFVIDILWLDKDFKVLSMSEGISPDTYPKVFYPKMPAKYVFEAESGFIKKNSISLGQKIDIRLP